MKSYKLINNIPVPCELDEIQMSDNTICYNQFGDVEVSTVFLSWDHSFGDDEPILFETMVFGGEYNDYQLRYTSYEMAIKGHNETCEMVDKIKKLRQSKLGDLGI